jgi:hypothetical protein
MSYKLIESFNRRCHDAIASAINLGYTPSRMIEMMKTRTPYDIAKRMVISGDIQDGLKKMKKLNRLDLTLESMMLEEEYNSIFTKDEKLSAKFRLEHIE